MERTDKRLTAMIVNYPISCVAIIHIHELSLYKVVMQKTFEYIKEETLSLENIKDAPLQYCNDDFDIVINELRKTFIVGLLLDDLGFKASDLLQSNCVIWVEGPSDRIYIKKMAQTIWR